MHNRFLQYSGILPQLSVSRGGGGRACRSGLQPLAGTIRTEIHGGRRTVLFSVRVVRAPSCSLGMHRASSRVMRNPSIVWGLAYLDMGNAVEGALALRRAVDRFRISEVTEVKEGRPLGFGKSVLSLTVQAY